MNSVQLRTMTGDGTRKHLASKLTPGRHALPLNSRVLSANRTGRTISRYLKLGLGIQMTLGNQASSPARADDCAMAMSDPCCWRHRLSSPYTYVPATATPAALAIAWWVSRYQSVATDSFADVDNTLPVKRDSSSRLPCSSVSTIIAVNFLL